jgi:hypothetical protein
MCTFHTAAVVLCILCSSAASSEPTVAIFDAGNSSMQQCSEGPKSYITDCVFPSDFFTYELMDKPTISKDGVTCESMGYKLLNQDPVFKGFKQYWKGATSAEAKASFGKWVTNSFNASGHPELMQFLNFTRDHNPACKIQGTPARIKEGATAKYMVHDDTPSAYIDACGGSDQCADGNYSYLVNCVKPSDYFAYMHSKCPIIVKQTCAKLGYDFFQQDPIFDFKIYWKGGPSAANKWFASFAPGHPDNVKFITKTKQDNPACST